MTKWAIVGLGFIAQKHLDAIKDSGGELIMACDADLSKKEKVVGVDFFQSWQLMIDSSRFAEVEWVAICTPNYLHFPMSQDATRRGKKVLCEKPLTIDTDYLDTLGEMKDVYTVLQLRHNPEIQELKNNIRIGSYTEASMNINMHRGDFYHNGWKGKEEQSGGLLFNIGIHYFDLLIYLFGPCIEKTIYNLNSRFADGICWMEKAKVSWHISIDAPMDNQNRLLTIGDQVIRLDRHFEGLHLKVYQDVLAGKGTTVYEASKAIRLVESLKNYK